MTTAAPSRSRALSAATVIVASAVALDPGGWYPFGPAKWHAVLLAVLAAVWIHLGRSDAALTLGRRNTAQRRFWLVWVALIALLGVAAVFGREPYYGWVGTPERRLGWLTWVVFAVCCWLGTLNASRSAVRLIGRAVSVVTLGVGGYCAIELAWRAPIQVDTVGQRIGGPYGSSAFLGAALCLLIPVTASVAFDRGEGLAWRTVSGAATMLAMIALIGSGTRAAVVGLVASLGVFLFALRVAGRRNPGSDDQTPTTTNGTARATTIGARMFGSRAVIGGLGVAVVIGGLAVLGVGGRFDTSVSRLGRVSDSSRAAEWAVGARIVAAHPLLGVGPEGYRTALADGITAEYERNYGRDVIPDRAHNGVIDVAAAGGLGAGVLYFTLMVAVVVAGWRRLRTGTTLDRGVAVAAIAYVVQQCFLFPVSTIDPVFWIFAGILVTQAATPAAPDPQAVDSDDSADGDDLDVTEPAPIDEPALAGGSDAKMARGYASSGAHRASQLSSRHRIGRGIVLMLAGAVIVSGVLALSADRLAAQAVRADRDDLAARATRLRPDFVRYWLLDDRLSPMTVSGINAGLESIDAAAQVSPRDPVVNRRHAERLLDLAIATGEDFDRTRAVDAWAALARDVNCYRCHLGYGYALALDGNRDGAINAFERAASLARRGDDEAQRNLDALAAAG